MLTAWRSRALKQKVAKSYLRCCQPPSALSTCAAARVAASVRMVYCTAHIITASDAKVASSRKPTLEKPMLLKCVVFAKLTA
jgi:hypothetical protein